MRTLVEEPQQAAYWQAIVDGETADFEAIFSKFQATVDAPACFLLQRVDG